MKLYVRIVRAVLLAFIALVLTSSAVLAAYSYYATIQVQETSGNSYDYLPIIADIDNDYLADNGYISLTGLDTRVLSGSTELKHMLADDKVLFVVPLVGANSTGNYKYTLGNSTLDPAVFPTIVGNNGYVTIADDDDLELGSNFTIEQKGWVNTDYSASISYQGAGAIAYISSGNVTPALPTGWLPNDVWLCFIASLDNVNSTLPAGWTAIDAGTNNGTGLRTTLYWRRAVTGDTAPLVTHAAGAGISTVVVGYRGVTPFASPFDVNQSVFVKTPTSIVNNFGAGMTTTINNCTIVLLSGIGGTTLSDTYTGTPTPTERIDGPNTAGRPELVVADFLLATPGATGSRTSTITSFLNNGYQLSLVPASSDKKLVFKETAFRTYVSAEGSITSDILGGSPRSVTITGVSSGELIVKTTANGTNMTLSVTNYTGTHQGNSPQSVDITGVSVPANTNDWLLMQNNVMPYMEYYKHTAVGYPKVEGRSTGATTAVDTTSHAITLPSGIQIGELLLVVFSVDGIPTCTDGSGLWTKLGQTSYTTTSPTAAIFYKVATGGDSLTITTSVAEQSSHVAFRISNYSGVPTGTAATGDGTNSDPPNHNPGVLKYYLWIATRSGDAQVVATGAPANYNNLQTQAGSGNAGASSNTAERALYASSEDPGTFTSATEQWVSYTISVPPVTTATFRAWYQPISIITATTLDDREGTDVGETGTGEEDAIITWGSNPAGVTATVGSLISSSQPAISPAGEEEIIDIIPEGSVPSGGGINTVALQDNPLYPVVELMTNYTNFTEEQIWFGGATLIILIGMALAIGKIPNHLLVAGVVGFVLDGFFVAMQIYPWWTLLIFGFFLIGSLVMERKPVL